ncbi:MAG: cytochrome c3 family protein, partial [bacterium]|nr:cytochrome c3 family protein [bacterium]
MTAQLLRHRQPVRTALLLCIIGVIPLRAADAVPARSVTDRECRDCHESFTSPVHKSLGCLDCHDSITESPHASRLPKVDCASCHERVAAQHAFHPRLAQSPLPAGADTSCAECHGKKHDTVGLKSPDSPWTGPRQAESCGRCHEVARKDYLASAHAQKPGVERTAPDCLSCHQEPIVHPGAKGSLVALKLAQARLCESCHVGNAVVAGSSNLGAKFVASFDHSVHGAALQAGNAQAATCVDCHGAHAMNRAAVAGAKVNRLHITETCAKCHADQAKEYNTSVHAVALRRGNVDSAGCTSCHGEHDIKLHTDAASPVHKANLAQQVCAECHASVRL